MSGRPCEIVALLVSLFVRCLLHCTKVAISSLRLRSICVLMQVGHKAAVMVAAFSPRMYKFNRQLVTCLALGSQVRIVS